MKKIILEVEAPGDFKEGVFVTDIIKGLADGVLGARIIDSPPEAIVRAEPDQQSLSDMNAALCELSKRWILDGDYLRCKRCKRPHIASKFAAPFLHEHDCKFANVGSEYPWRLLVNLLSPLYRSPSAEAIFEHIKHGDAGHQNWLLNKLREIIPLYAAPHTDAAPLAGEADTNAPWLSLAHHICTDNGVPQGNIEWRLTVLRDLISIQWDASNLLRECLDALSDFDHDKRVAMCVKLRALLGVE